MAQHSALRRLGGSVAAALLATAVAGAIPASPDASDGGRWFITKTGIAELQQRATGAGIRVALVDGLINPGAPDLVGTNLTVSEPAFCADVEGGAPMSAASTSPAARHSTSMASIVLGTGTGINGEEGVHGVAPGAEVIAYADRVADNTCPSVGESDRDPNRTYAFGQAVADGADIIFVPGGVRVFASDLATALRNRAIVLGSAGNHAEPMVDQPAIMNGVAAIGMIGVDGQIANDSAVDPRLGVVAPGMDFRGIKDDYASYYTTDGASNATAYTAGVLALVWSAYPEATGNQMLQAMVRTTGGTVHDPQRIDDRSGYGIVNARQMMSVNPMTLPDTNPFLSDDPELKPTASEVLGEHSPGGEPSNPTATPSQGTTATPGGEGGARSGPPVGLIVAISAASIGAATAAATAVIASRKRSRASTTSRRANGTTGSDRQ